MRYSTVSEVDAIFGGMICPHCNEAVNILDEGDNPDTLFGYFQTTKADATPECRSFNALLSEKLMALRNDQMTEAEVLDWCQQYKP